jgi:hypothetical protein
MFILMQQLTSSSDRVDQGDAIHTERPGGYLLIPHQGLLAVPFVLHSHPTAVFEPNDESVDHQANIAQRRYAEIMRDVEEIINDHSKPVNR